MNYKTYFKKYGKVYGVSYKFNFEHWSGYIETFTNLEDAKKWLNTEEGDSVPVSLAVLITAKSVLHKVVTATIKRRLSRERSVE